MYKRSKQPAAKRYVKAAKTLSTKKVDKVQSKALATLQRQVKQLQLAPERKYLDLSTNLSLNTTGQVLMLSSVTPGTTDNTRIGDQIRMTSLNIRLDMNSTTPTFLSQVRIILFRLPGNLDLMTINPQINQILVSNTMVSPHIIESYGTYTIYHDRVYQFDSNNPQRLLKISKLLHNAVAKWDPSLIATNETTGHIFIALFSDQTITPVNCVFYSRLRYIDS